MLFPAPPKDLAFRVFEVGEDFAFEECDRFAWLTGEQTECPLLMRFRADEDILVLCRLTAKDV